jgi:hypothetical protein
MRAIDCVEIKIKSARVRAENADVASAWRG